MTATIRVSNLGKCYRVRNSDQRVQYRTIRESLVDLTKAPARMFRRPPDDRSEEFWALRNVEFEVKAGEIVGIIGHNGAGKSTLLKILSRITKPTSGRIELNGRVGSLLEVGTGFHPELTGRENIYLNGSILGMRRSEIQASFDEIVDFAETGRFLDTPVKRYSSGMYVRLAFAVAAHLPCEILVVDEVLAVGDVSFQRKCMDKMSEVGRTGRTILLVSHNLSSIKSLCHNVVTMERGRVIDAGPADEQVASYFNRLVELSKYSLAERKDRSGNGLSRVKNVYFENEQRDRVTQIFVGDPLRIKIDYESHQVGLVPEVALSCFSLDGVKVFHVDNKNRGQAIAPLAESGEFLCSIPRVNLTPGTYHFNVQISVKNEVCDHLASAGALDVLPGDYYGSGRPASPQGGTIFLDHDWAD